MLVSLLLDQEGQLVAGGWACDQLPLGNRYWRDVLGVTSIQDYGSDRCETAVIDLNDRELVNQVLRFHLDPSAEQRQGIMARLDQPLMAKRRAVVARFAA